MIATLPLELAEWTDERLAAELRAMLDVELLDPTGLSAVDLQLADALAEADEDGGGVMARSDDVHDGATLVREIAARALEPDRVLSVAAWADMHRQLSTVSAKEPGQFRTSRTPYTREPMEAMSITSTVRRVSLMFGAQLGKTETLNNLAGYIIHHAPGPTLFVQPSLEIARLVSRTRLDPMIAESPALARLVSPARSRDAGNSVFQKSFPGGFLRLVGANSAAGLRSMPVRFLLRDEIDVWPRDADGEGDPLSLSTARTRTFTGREKIIDTSTPTIEGRSAIAAAYDEGDQSEYFVPCPECQHEQTLRWTQLKFERDDAGDLIHNSVAYACEACGTLLGEHHKTGMLARGRWIARVPSRSARHRSFRLNALYSPIGFYPWTAAVEDFLKAKGDEAQLRVWVNTVLAETYQERGDAPPWERLYNRREPYPIGVVPRGACILTAGVDVQKDRVELEVVGWGPDFESWSVDYVVIAGRPEDAATLEQLARVIARSYPIEGSEGGAGLSISKVGVDTGYATQHMYTWIRTQRADQVFALKGGPPGYPVIVGQPRKAEVLESGKKLRRGLQLWTVGTGIVKGELYGWLRQEQPTDTSHGWPRGWCHFPEQDEEWFKQMCSEVLMPRVKLAKSGREKGRVYEWEKTRERNEVLDCRVYARAALAIAGADRWTDEDWRRMAETLGRAPRRRDRRRGEGGGWLARHR